MLEYKSHLIQWEVKSVVSIQLVEFHIQGKSIWLTEHVIMCKMKKED